MKNLKHIILPLIAMLFIVSCSEDNNDSNTNNNNNNGGNIIEGNYFPSTVNNYWKYDVTSTDNTTNQNIVSLDSLYVVAETVTTAMLDVNDGLAANGPIIGLLASGTLTKSDTTLAVDGALELPAEITDLIDFDIALNNFILYNIEANNNTQLASNSNSITQDFNGFPLTIAYQLKSTALGHSENLNLNGTSFSNVVSSKMTLNLSVSTTITVAGISFPLSILNAQDILVSTNYYVEDIGLVQADSNTNYQISATAITALEAAGVNLPIPASGSTSVLQALADYSLAE
ncbi:hypothetical protein [Lacinutrix sp.]|uniref:hypothetical protein n=1 Tax=Lacinutrix sp. TaxID=1937692 RepID=UPI00261EBF25|nr:hypothetical protein [Lacinutrix sp.]MDG1715474.1 hypothetical protein [Lacinutrix sp.]